LRLTSNVFETCQLLAKWGWFRRKNNCFCKCWV